MDKAQIEELFDEKQEKCNENHYKFYRIKGNSLNGYSLKYDGKEKHYSNCTEIEAIIQFKKDLNIETYDAERFFCKGILQITPDMLEKIYNY